MAIAMFGAGCFWGVESAFRKMPGVIRTAVGYSGGRTPNPTYNDVCNGGTGHAEVVIVEYDPAKATYSQFLDLFWSIHNPTLLADQYRSAIFVFDDGQDAEARASKTEMTGSGRFRRPIVTEIVRAAEFWMAEEEHQQHDDKPGGCRCHPALSLKP